MSERLRSAIARAYLKRSVEGREAWDAYMSRGGVRADLPFGEWRMPLSIYSRRHERCRHLLAAAMGREVEAVVGASVIALGPIAAKKMREAA